MSSNSPGKAPVVFIVFNRPDVTRKVLARIREYQPDTLLVIADGPRPHKEGEAEKVQAVRQVIEEMVDWKCDLRCEFSATNLGCRQRIASGLNWAFEQVEEAIILEDDCLPDPSFFDFCATLLEKYRNDPRIVHIGGANVAAEHTSKGPSYWFTRHAWIWGWATWRRAWSQYDFEMKTWDERHETVRSSFASGWESAFWISTWNEARKDLVKVNTWDFAWMYTCRSTGGLSILPATNLIQNIGFGADSTHTGDELRHLRMNTKGIGAVRHPARLEVDRYRDELISRAYSGERITPLSNLKSWLRVTLAGRG